MKYIKVRFRLSSPSADPFDSYGWDTLWNKKTQLIGGEPIEPGQIINFQAITVRPDGRCLVLSTKRNLKAIKAMVEKKQMSLAPGETLDMEEAQIKRVEDAWPAEPGTPAADESDLNDIAPGEIAEEAIVNTPKKRRNIKDEDLNPDVE